MDVFLSLRKVTMAMPNVRGARRISEVVRWLGSRSGAVRVIDDFDDDLVFACHLDSHISSQIFWFGAYSHSQLALLGRILRPRMTFVDIGANEGEQTVFAAKRLEEGRVIAFEPNERVFSMLDVNVRLNGLNNVTLVRTGLADHIGAATLFEGDGRFSDGSFNRGLSSVHPRSGVSSTVGSIPLDTLDAYVERNAVTRVDVMKIDVEGSELSVLRGAERVLAVSRPKVIVEINEVTSRAGGYHAREILEFLSARRYEVEGILNDGSTYPLKDFSDSTHDVLCIPLP